MMAEKRERSRQKKFIENIENISNSQVVDDLTIVVAINEGGKRKWIYHLYKWWLQELIQTHSRMVYKAEKHTEV